MKVYLAARFSLKPVIKQYAADLAIEGVGCTSSWLNQASENEGKISAERSDFLTEHALIDLADIDAADWLVLFSVDPTIPIVRGGRHVEFGYALGTKKPILVVGPKENIFHYLPSIRRVSTWPEAVKFLKQVAVQDAVAATVCC